MNLEERFINLVKRNSSLEDPSILFSNLENVHSQGERFYHTLDYHIADSLEKLNKLSEFEIHSIEQPIKQGQLNEMAELCEKTPIPIALDEELIGIFDVTKKKELLQIVNPQYIILKPSLVGGFKGSEEWIQLAENMNIDWWITSALESNVGLNAIAQWTYSLNSKMPQGLGTGGLFTNNFESPLEVKKGHLHYNNTKNWKFNLL